MVVQWFVSWTHPCGASRDYANGVRIITTNYALPRAMAGGRRAQDRIGDARASSHAIDNVPVPALGGPPLYGSHHVRGHPDKPGSLD